MPSGISGTRDALSVLCAELRLVSLEHRRDSLLCCQVYRIVHHLDCTQFSSYFSFSRTDTCTFLTVYGKHSKINARFTPFMWNSL